MKNLLNPSSLLWVFGHIVALLLGAWFWALSGNPSMEGYKPILQGVAGSLIASGIAGEILFLYVMKSEDLRDKLQTFVVAGLAKIFPVRSVQIKEEYDVLLSRAKEIDIIGFGLSSLREDYSHKFGAWSRQARVRILILDPNYPDEPNSYADQRDREERNPVGKIRRDVNAFLQDVYGNGDIVAEKFQVRLLRSLPSVNLFRVDDQLFWGPYLALQQSRNTPTLLVKDGFLYDRLREHFESLWNDGQFSSPAGVPAQGVGPKLAGSPDSCTP